ncbi:hypothetical protein [Bifidobacterium panos]|nr:hypothetical protein [Bifidobacterium sp. DSM 109963]
MARGHTALAGSVSNGLDTASACRGVAQPEKSSIVALEMNRLRAFA